MGATPKLHSTSYGPRSVWGVGADRARRGRARRVRKGSGACILVDVVGWFGWYIWVCVWRDDML